MVATRKGGAVVFDDGSVAQAVVPVDAATGTPVSGAGDASEATLAGVLTELGEKFEPGGSVAPQQIISTTATVTRVASSATTGQLLAANTSRVGVILHNNSTAALYLKYGTTADIAGGDESYTYKIPADAVWEMPQPPYTGRIDCIWASANGFAAVTEET